MDSFYRRLEAALASAYTIERELTGGGMSHVYLATEKALGRTVVVKVLPPDLAAGVNRERFRREIHLAAQLQHPHIVPLLTAGEDGDLLYYTMPFVSGESLKVRLEERGALPIRDVVRILTDVVDALAYAHARGVVHRDIKPGNVLTQRSHALVTDFGVAKALSASLPAVGATTSGLAIGTPAYMAPEQLAADPAADHRVDLYAVGLLAYELLTGEAPFAGASPTATMAAQLTRDPDPIETRRPDVPAELSAIVRRCLAKDPAMRPPTADALLASLEELPAAALTPTRSTPARGTMMGRRGGRAGLLAGGFTALLLLGILLGRRVGAAGNVSPGPDTLPVVLAGDSVEPVALVGDTAEAEPSPDASPAPATVLTRADSMAIAEAVQRRLARENATRGRGEAIVNEDSLTRLVSRVMIDSLLRVAQLTRDERFARIRGLDTRIFVMTPDSGARSWSWSGPRPITVVPLIAPNDPGARAVHAMADTLRRVLARSRRFVPRDADVPGEDRSDLVATVQLQELRGDSVRIRIELIDPLAEPSLMHRVVSGRPAASADQLRGAEDLARSAATTLTQMSRSPRRPPNTVEFHAPEIPTPPDPSR
ncbi:MAG TPA: serine/threonine-protein kinase [Gemmatimonadales bacterium]|nr:serine/threonine-protein kinase [Gemmatimonadales bacterium]